jgi:serine/threonine protein kinase
MEFYGIHGKSMNFAEAVNTRLFSDEKDWARTLLKCAAAIHHLHEKNYIHCDLKGDNIVLTEVHQEFVPVIIDFGKMKQVSKAKLKKLSVKEQDRYSKYHKHIAPEIVRGTHPPSKASDVYAFGLVISLLCFYQRIENLRLIAVSCINGTPERRPTIEQIITKLKALE